MNYNYNFKEGIKFKMMIRVRLKKKYSRKIK